MVFPEGADKNAKEKARAEYGKKMKEYEDRGLSLKQARGYCRRDKVFTKAMGANGPKFIADVLRGEEGFDFKFNCADSGEMEQGQIKAYKKWLK